MPWKTALVAVDRPPPPVVPPDVYDADYYESCCAGFAEWSTSSGRAMAGVYPATLDRAGFAAGQTVVDIGTGRGELVALAVQRGAARAVGVEYSAAAIELARKTLRAHDIIERAELILADARAVPLPDQCADLVTMLDVVEHLAAAELTVSLAEAHRLLRPGGRLLIHTFPNRSIYDITYRTLWLLGGHRKGWPKDPRNDYERLMHVGEQSKLGLTRALRRARFHQVRVELGAWVYTDFVPGPRGRQVYERLARLPLINRWAVGNLWAQAIR